MMRIQFKTEGGLAAFPGLSTPLTIERSALSAAEAQTLQRLVEDARFFALPAQVGASPRGAADMRHYTITVEENGRNHTVRVVEPVTNPDLQRLLDYLQAQAKLQRQAARASAASKRPTP
jgi:Emfourin